MLRILAILLGLAFAMLGFLGLKCNSQYIPYVEQIQPYVKDYINDVIQSHIYLIVGSLSVICGVKSSLSAKIYFLLWGIFFCTLAILGHLQGPAKLLDFIPIVKEDFFHGGFGLALLLIGAIFKN